VTRILVTGGTGSVGRFIVTCLLERQYQVTVAGRTPPPASMFQSPVGFRPLTLDPKTPYGPIVEDMDCLVHAAFDHVPGRYRGGEGDDIRGFWDRNFLSTLLLFHAAQQAGLRRGVFLSSRAVYGIQSPGSRLDEQMECHPDTHYGAVKLACERHLSNLSTTSNLTIASLRATGVYGQARTGQKHKWRDLFDDYLSGKTIEPRCGTEIHGRDLARAVVLLLEQPAKALSGECFNASDLLLDHHDLLNIVKQHRGCPHPLPARVDATAYNAMSTERLTHRGWQPGGESLLRQSVVEMLERFSTK
tara:strand:- start:159161 stop:160069 length:909 start_codon:yes stop_codon:yes gene_type:complete